jgi:hypothetical protein
MRGIRNLPEESTTTALEGLSCADPPRNSPHQAADRPIASSTASILWQTASRMAVAGSGYLSVQKHLQCQHDNSWATVGRLLQSPLDIFPESASGGPSCAANSGSNRRAAAHDRPHCGAACGADGSTAQRPLLPWVMLAHPATPSHNRTTPRASTRFMSSSSLVRSQTIADHRAPDADLRNPE